jgi:hypothetical protein
MICPHCGGRCWEMETLTHRWWACSRASCGWAGPMTETRSRTDLADDQRRREARKRRGVHAAD